MDIRKITTAVFITSTLLMFGCSSSSNKSGGGGDSVAEYNGTWTQACVDEGFGESSVTVLDINGSTGTSTSYEYTDANCAVPAVPAVFTAAYSMVYPGGTTTTALGEARHIDLTPTSFEIDSVPLTAEQLAQATAGGAFNTDYGLIHLADDTLYVGENTDVLDGTTAAKRPLELDTVDVFVRQ